jgi:hypothetical protein
MTMEVVRAMVAMVAMIWLSSYYDWFTPWLSGVITLLTSLLSCKLVVASSLV